MPVVIILLAVIALAVAPQAIINLARLLDWLLRTAWTVMLVAICVGFWVWLFSR